jgi:glutamate synthase domain-containing protein 2
MKTRWARVLPVVPVAAVAAVAAYDLAQKKHALLRNFPVVGHLRYLLESVGPELRQYIISGNDEERPFSRNQRRWVYASSKMQNNYFGFGTDSDMEYRQGYPVVKHRTFAKIAPHAGVHSDDNAVIPCAKVLGGARNRAKAFRPNSVVNISGMSFGALSGAAIEALNRGAAVAGCLHNTGEGGLSPHHLHGADVVFQIGTSYFGCRDRAGRFDIHKLKDTIAAGPVKAIEIKLSQGAKPGLGGLLPAEKVTPEIATIRGIPVATDCASPSRHTAFTNVDQMLDWIEMLATETGLPVGIKSAVGNLDFWHELAEAMASGDRGVDFITVDGGEGGTGAAPLIFSESVALPFRVGFARISGIFASAGVAEKVVFNGSGKLGLPDNAIVAFALGVDMVSVSREAMLAIGCIQAQRCHTGECPTGIATQNRWLSRGLDPTVKSVRAANYICSLRRDLLKVSEACGVSHPSLIGVDDLDILNGQEFATTLRAIYQYQAGWGQPAETDTHIIDKLMAQINHQAGD